MQETILKCVGHRRAQGTNPGCSSPPAPQEREEWLALSAKCAPYVASIGIRTTAAQPMPASSSASSASDPAVELMLWALSCVRSRSFAAPYFRTPASTKLQVAALLQLPALAQVGRTGEGWRGGGEERGEGRRGGGGVAERLRTTGMLQLPALAQVRGAQGLRMKGMLQLPVLAQVGRKGMGGVEVAWARWGG